MLALPGTQRAMNDPALPHPDLVAAIPRLRRYARVLTGEASRADDLVQDTLARAWEKRALWQAGTDLRAWLFTVMHNVFVNQRALARRDAANVSLDGAGAPETWQLSVRADQHVHVELHEVLQQLGKLPAEQREVLILAAVEELKYEEIAACARHPRRNRDVAPLARKGEAAQDRVRSGAAQDRPMSETSW